MNQWRTHPKLQGKFLPDYPDDLQIIAHDGGPRITQTAPELVWVSVTAMDGEVFSGRLLNQPAHLRSVVQGGTVRFLAAAGAPYPMLVTEKYLSEREGWNLTACEKCGFDELFDAPSDLMRAVFPNLPRDAVMEMFTALCPLCGGVQGVEAVRDVGSSQPAQPVARKRDRPWWRFWS